MFSEKLLNALEWEEIIKQFSREKELAYWCVCVGRDEKLVHLPKKKEINIYFN